MKSHAILLIDLVDSTKLVDELGDIGAAEIFARHDRRARDLLAKHGGTEVDHTDGFLFTFDEPGDAIRFALDYHAGMGELRARAAIHVGPVIRRENTAADVARGAKRVDVEGLAKPVTARLAGIAGPGQTLLSAAAKSAIEDAVPEQAEIILHGHYRLKGIEEPIEVFELARRGARAPRTPPPDVEKAYRVFQADGTWYPAKQIRQNLPVELDPFVGRTEELKSLWNRLSGNARLVTVSGPAGTGKTRLVRRYGWTHLADWPGGVYFCDLSEARSCEGILFSVASALGVGLAKDDPSRQIGHAIAGRPRCLVILDNFEQVIEHAAETLGHWLERAVDATFVVTSRARLNLAGETLLPLDPMDLEQDALELFETRASAQSPGFRLNGVDRRLAQEVVRLLDGLPLAIELAAARMRVLSLAQILDKMRNRFALLSRRSHGLERQGTLRTAIDWSWNLLLGWEKGALAQCAAFDGGFTLEAAEAVVDLSEWADPPGILDVVQALVDKSLLRIWRPAAASSDGSGREPRFGMFISIREYARERLDGMGPMTLLAAEERHGRYFARHGAAASLAALYGAQGTSRRASLSLELDNLVLACRRAIARNDGAAAMATYLATWEVLELRGPFSVGVRLGVEVLALAELAQIDRVETCAAAAAACRMAGRAAEARALLEEALSLLRQTPNRRLEGIVRGSLGTLSREQGRIDEARAELEAALAIHEEVGNDRALGTAHSTLGGIHFEQGRIDDALRHLRRAAAVHREMGNRRDEGIALGNQAILHFDQGRLDEARSAYEESLSVAREIGDRRVEGMVLGNLSIVLHELGKRSEAQPLYETALSIHREVGNRRFESNVLCNLGNLLLEEGQVDEALRHYESALPISQELGDVRQQGLVLSNLGNVYHQRGDARALETYEEALAMHVKVGNRRDQGIVLGILAELFAAEGHLEKAQDAIDRGEALLRGVGNQIEIAKVMCARGFVNLAMGSPPAARMALGEAETISLAIGADTDSDLGRKIAALRARCVN
jgi:predicted ATPase/class 3 adenylate cyclase/Tfp pilus assembly protein PilF